MSVQENEKEGKTEAENRHFLFIHHIKGSLRNKKRRKVQI